MADTDPVRHPFTAGYEPLGGGAGDPLDGASPPGGTAAGADQARPAADDPPMTHQRPPGPADHDFAERLQVDPQRGDAKG
jgi:hypothetical protein